MLERFQLSRVNADDLARLAQRQRERLPRHVGEAGESNAFWHETSQQTGEIRDAPSQELRAALTIVKVSLQLAHRQLPTTLRRSARPWFRRCVMR
jgi:hypothetical protein